MAENLVAQLGLKTDGGLADRYIPNFRTLFMDLFERHFGDLPKLHWSKPEGRFVSVALALKVLNEYGALEEHEQIHVAGCASESQKGWGRDARNEAGHAIY